MVHALTEHCISRLRAQRFVLEDPESRDHITTTKISHNDIHITSALQTQTFIKLRTVEIIHTANKLHSHIRIIVHTFVQIAAVTKKMKISKQIGINIPQQYTTRWRLKDKPVSYSFDCGSKQWSRSPGPVAAPGRQDRSLLVNRSEKQVNGHYRLEKPILQIL